MRDHLEIINDIQVRLEKENLIYESKSLKNVLSIGFTTSTELIGEVGELLAKMIEKEETKKAIGHLVTEFLDNAKEFGLVINPSKFYSLEQKTFEIDGQDFNNLKEFFNVIGQQLVEGNEWGRNMNALNDILKGGFIKTEYGEPIRLIWRNSDISKQRLVDFDDIIELIKEHDHVDLELK